MRNSSRWLVAFLLFVLTYGVWRLFELRFATGNIYPPYSSLRTDPQGARALYDALAALPGLAVQRHYRPLEKLPEGRRTLLFLGASPRGLENSIEEITEFEKLATSGTRILIGFRSVEAEQEEKKENDAKKQPKLQSLIEKRWGVRFTYKDKDGADTALRFEAIDPAWSDDGDVWEKRFGAGSILLLADSRPLSNQALEKDRDTAFLVRLIGSDREIIFEESHLGVYEAGSVMGLARKYNLGAAAFALLILAGLFIWKNSVSLLPPRDLPDESAAGLTQTQDASSGFANLLRRNIPQSDIVKVCVSEWERARENNRFSGSKVARVRALALGPGDPAEIYRQITATLAERK